MGSYITKVEDLEKYDVFKNDVREIAGFQSRNPNEDALKSVKERNLLHYGQIYVDDRNKLIALTIILIIVIIGLFISGGFAIAYYYDVGSISDAQTILLAHKTTAETPAPAPVVTPAKTSKFANASLFSSSRSHLFSPVPYGNVALDHERTISRSSFNCTRNPSLNVYMACP